MARFTKIATCCYCGTRAALVLGEDRHELTCSGCGAALHNLKQLPSDSTNETTTARKNALPQRGAGAHWEKKAKPKKKKKSKKGFGRRLFEEAFDVLDDIFD